MSQERPQPPRQTVAESRLNLSFPDETIPSFIQQILLDSGSITSMHYRHGAYLQGPYYTVPERRIKITYQFVTSFSGDKVSEGKYRTLGETLHEDLI